MNTGDRVGDAYIAAAFAQRGGRSRAPQGRSSRPWPAASRASRIHPPSSWRCSPQINTDPDWVDWEKVEHGAEVFRR